MAIIEKKPVKIKREDECVVCDSEEYICEPADCKDFKIKLRKIEEETEHEEKTNKK